MTRQTQPPAQVGGSRTMPKRSVKKRRSRRKAKPRAAKATQSTVKPAGAAGDPKA